MRNRPQKPRFNTEQLRDISGIYAFFLGDLCLYVGKAVCIRSRIAGHKARFRDADALRVWDYTEDVNGMDMRSGIEFLSIMEAVNIWILKPILNKKRPCIHRMMRKDDAATTPARIRAHRDCIIYRVLSLVDPIYGPKGHEDAIKAGYFPRHVTPIYPSQRGIS